MTRRRVRRRSSPLAAIAATLGAWAFAGMVFVALNQMGRDGVENTPAPSGDWRQGFQGRIDGVTDRLAHGLVQFTAPAVRMQGSGEMRWTHRQYEKAVPRVDAAKLRAALELACGGDPAVALSVVEQPDGLRADIGVDGLLTHTVIVRWAATGRARAAVVIDDLGNDLLVAREVVALEAPIVLSVMPFRPFSREVAELGRLFDREVMLHLPMEPNHGNGQANGGGVLLRVSAGRDEIVRLVDESLGAVPYVVGVNNHMGSRFTEDRERVRWMLERVGRRKLFFLDSRTTPASVVQEIAAAVGVPCVSRSVFLDDPSDAATVEQRMADVLDTARETGAAIAIGHPRPETIEALKRLPAEAQARGVELVPISMLVGPR